MQGYVLTVWLIWGPGQHPQQIPFPDEIACESAELRWDHEATAWLQRNSALSIFHILIVSRCDPESEAPVTLKLMP
jgi:hypothetical protein